MRTNIIMQTGATTLWIGDVIHIVFVSEEDKIIYFGEIKVTFGVEVWLSKVKEDTAVLMRDAHIVKELGTMISRNFGESLEFKDYAVVKVIGIIGFLHYHSFIGERQFLLTLNLHLPQARFHEKSFLIYLLCQASAQSVIHLHGHAHDLIHIKIFSPRHFILSFSIISAYLRNNICAY